MVASNNILLNTKKIGNSLLLAFCNNLVMVKLANRKYADEFGNREAQIGTTFSIRLQNFLQMTKGPVLDVQSLDESVLVLVITEQGQVSLPFSSSELKFNLQNLEENIFYSVGVAMAQGVDQDVVTQAQYSYNMTCGTPKNGQINFADASLPALQLTKIGAFANDKYLICAPDVGQGLRNSLQGTYNESLNKNISQINVLGKFQGFTNVFESQNLFKLTTGTMTPITVGGNITVTTSGQSGSSINVTGFAHSTANVLLAGDIIQIAGVHAINQPAARATDIVNGFVVLNNVSSDASGNATIVISPAINATTPYQTVDALPAAGAIVTCVGVATNGTAGTYFPTYLINEKSMFFAPAAPPISVGSPYSELFEDSSVGIPMRLNIIYLPGSDQSLMRVDTFYGTKGYYPLGVRATF